MDLCRCRDELKFHHHMTFQIDNRISFESEEKERLENEENSSKMNLAEIVDFTVISLKGSNEFIFCRLSNQNHRKIYHPDVW